MQAIRGLKSEMSSYTRLYSNIRKFLSVFSHRQQQFLLGEVASLRRDIGVLGEQISDLAQNLQTLRYQTSDLAIDYRGDFYSKAKPDMTDYWTRHNVTAHASFGSAEESLAYFDHRNNQYPGYIELMPAAGHDEKVVLDYGCGPGNDLVGFACYSRPSRLIGMDISQASLAQAKERLALHDKTAELFQLTYGDYNLPLADASVDYLHCSGVLMLVENPLRLLKEFRRIIKPDGELRLMVYNYDSVWLHLYVAYILQLESGIYADISVREAFSRTTDGEDCPLVYVWNTAEMDAMAQASGFRSQYLGAAPSLWELHVLPKRFRAALHPGLAEEHRDFLMSLSFDNRGLPQWKGRGAGIDGCYSFFPT